VLTTSYSLPMDSLHIWNRRAKLVPNQERDKESRTIWKRLRINR
jgi:hypothetical protein